MRGVLFAAGAAALPAVAPKPHIFVVIVDDWGWNDAGFHQDTPDPAVTTPNIDRLVSKGMNLTRHYTYNYCSPSRSSFQSGRLPLHVWTGDDDPLAHNPADTLSGYAGIPPNMTTIAWRLRDAGYRAHMTGKWDCGFAHWAQHPGGRGYESYFGYLHHANDYYNETLDQGSVVHNACQDADLVDLWEVTSAGGRPALRRNGTVYEEDMFTNHTLSVLDQHDSREPLFMVHAFHIVHTPLQCPQDYMDKYSFVKDIDHRTYSAMVKHMDDTVGQFVDKLEAKGMWDTTFFAQMSDNGGPIYPSAAASNRPLRGGKLSDWEGGIRVNAFVSGGVVPASLRGTSHDGYIHIVDWYATFCAMAGIADAADSVADALGLPPVDSINQWPSLLKNAPSPRTEIHVSDRTLINGSFKLLTGSPSGISGTNNPFFGKICTDELVCMDGYWDGYPQKQAEAKMLMHTRNCSTGCIYNIVDDPFEYTELSSEPGMADLKKAMIDRLAVLNKSVFAPDRGSPDQAGCAHAEANGGFYGPFLGNPI